MKKSTLIESTMKSNVKKNNSDVTKASSPPKPPKNRLVILTAERSTITGEFKCVDCDNEELNG